MTKLLRFAELQERGIARSWAQLKNLQKNRGFPLGVMISANSRAWTEDEIAAWLASLPTTGPAPRGAAKGRRGRPGKRKPEAGITANP